MIDTLSISYKYFFVTIKKLKNILENYDESLQVYLRGYEGGCDTLKKINLSRVKKNVHNAWYYGKHEINNEDYDEEGILLE